MKPYYKSLSYTINAYSEKNGSDPKITQIDRSLIKQESGKKPKIKQHTDLFLDKYKISEGTPMSKLDLILLAESYGIDVDDLLCCAILEAANDEDEDEDIKHYKNYRSYKKKISALGAGIGALGGTGLSFIASTVANDEGLLDDKGRISATILGGVGGALLGAREAFRNRKGFSEYKQHRRLLKREI